MEIDRKRGIYLPRVDGEAGGSCLKEWLNNPVAISSDYTYSIRVWRCAVQKKLTVTIDEAVYEGLRKNIGPRKISKFIEELVRPHVLHPDLESAYAEMARDKTREKEALEWAEIAFKDEAHETE